jgi:hypothetical protein
VGTTRTAAAGDFAHAVGNAWALRAHSDPDESTENAQCPPYGINMIGIRVNLHLRSAQVVCARRPHQAKSDPPL